MDPLAHHGRSALQPTTPPHAALTPEPVMANLHVAVLAVRGDDPVVAVVSAGDALPCGPFSPRRHRSLESGVRFLVQQQTGIELASVRQICTLGDCHEPADGHPTGLPTVAVCYLALVGPSQANTQGAAIWRSWYAYFPWEDWRHGKPKCLAEDIEPRLKVWARLTPAHCETRAPRDAPDREQRLRLAFGFDGAAWDEEKVLERYELLADAGLLGGAAAGADNPDPSSWRLPTLWHSLLGDQTRVLASAVGETRRSVKCRPAIFELMGDQFTLFELQKTAEAILGPHLHKQNFRRLVEGSGLVEPTGEYRFRTGGRPAQLYRFRHNVLLESLTPGVRIKPGRA